LFDTNAGYQWKQKTLNIDAIRLEPELQGRVKTDDTSVNRYAKAMQREDIFPPIQVAYVDRHYYVIDGFHRLAASRKQKIETIVANVATMTKEQARGMAITANRTCGLPLTTKDKKKLFDMYIDSGRHILHNGKVKSLRQIAEDCTNLSHTTVAKYLKLRGIKAGDPYEDNPFHTPWTHQEESTDDEKQDEASIMVHSLWKLFDTVEDESYKATIRNLLVPLSEHMTRELTGEAYVPALDATIIPIDHFEPFTLDV
jgi:hypothetical protein